MNILNCYELSLKRNMGFFFCKKCKIQKVDLLEVEASLIIEAFFASLVKNDKSFLSSNFQNHNSNISNLFLLSLGLIHTRHFDAHYCDKKY